MLRKLLAVALAVFLYAGTAHAFYCIHVGNNPNAPCIHWSNKAATLRLFLGAPPAPLANGTLSWDQNAIDAANDWNAVGSPFHFSGELGGTFNDPCGPRDDVTHKCSNTGPSGDNPVYFAPTFCGDPFGDIIELTNNCYDRNSGAMFNAPVFVNRNVLWNAYDGPLRVDAQSHVVYDIRRVLLHEFGHVLGLDHPDQHSQSVSAIMNSHISNLDRLQADDINGVFANYSTSQASSSGSSGCSINAAPQASILWLLAPLGVWMIRRKNSFIRALQSARCRRR